MDSIVFTLHAYHIAEKFEREKVWWFNRSAKRLLIVSTNLDGFSLVNYGQFAKLPPTKLSRYTVSQRESHGQFLIMQHNACIQI